MSLNYEELLARHIEAVDREARTQLERATVDIRRFADLAASRGLALDHSSFSYVPTIGIVAAAPGLAMTLLGAMRTERDGLLPYQEIASRLPATAHLPGYFTDANYMVMAHEWNRRGMHPMNNWAPRFIERFWELDLPGVEKYIAIDENRVRINVDDSAYFEADTWYGAPFNEDIRMVKPGIVKLRPPLDLQSHYIEFLFAKTYCLDIVWTEANGIKVFQALEFKTEDVQVEYGGNRYFPSRYLHAEFDVMANCFRHFDGAIQLYREDEYFLRRDGDFNMTAKALAHIKARSKKLFKLNGQIPTDTWVDLCCHFLPGNPLAFEYFTGAYPAHIVEILSNVRSRMNNI